MTEPDLFSKLLGISTYNCQRPWHHLWQSFVFHYAY